MSNANAKAFEEKLLTIDLVDGLRREQERLDAALNDGARMQVLRSEIQTYYAQAGITVSDALIDQAVAERQAQRLTFKPHKLSALGGLVAGAYIYRGRIAASVGVLAALTIGYLFVDYQISSAQQRSALAAYRSQLQQTLDEIGKAQSDIATLPATLATIESSQIPALPNWLIELQAAYQQSRLSLDEGATCNKLQLPEPLTLAWPGEAQLKTCRAALPGVQATVTGARQLVNDHRQLGIAVTQYGLLQQRLTANPALADWSAVATTIAAAKAVTTVGSDRVQFTTAVGKANTALDTVATVASAHGSATSCLNDALRQAGTADKKTLSGMLSEGAAFRKSATVDGIDAWSKAANSSCEFFTTELSLRIVSEPGVQSGVWRYYNGNKRAKTFYLIVDALAAGGGSGQALILSVEDQKTSRQHRFGVHVSERVFEAVKADKQDDGVLNNTDVGSKPANSFAWQLPSGFEPKFIAEW